MADDPAQWETPSGAFTLTPLPEDRVIPRRSWGPWATVGWTALAAFVMLATQVMTLVVSAFGRLVANPKLDPASIGPSGLLVAVATLVSLPLVVGLLALLIRVRGWRVREYLALRWPSTRGAVLAISGLIIWLAAFDVLTVALGRPLVPPVMVDVTLSAPLWLISLAVAVAAPIIEETLFRGFCFRGLAESPRLGPGMAIGITALAWAAMHVQYDLYGVATIYLLGLYLGLVRYWTGSTTLTIVLHGLANAVATIEAVYFSG